MAAKDLIEPKDLVLDCSLPILRLKDGLITLQVRGRPYHFQTTPAYIIGGSLEVCDILSSLTEVIATRVNVAET
jgi:hypothetical protein